MAQIPKLSTREIQVLQGLVDGKTSIDLANGLDLHINTVRRYLSRAKKKLRTKSSHHAVGLAAVLGMVKITQYTGLAESDSIWDRIEHPDLESLQLQLDN